MKYVYMYMYIAFNVTQGIQWCLEYQILVNDHSEGRENGIMHMLPKQWKWLCVILLTGMVYSRHCIGVRLKHVSTTGVVQLYIGCKGLI